MVILNNKKLKNITLRREHCVFRLQSNQYLQQYKKTHI